LERRRLISQLQLYQQYTKYFGMDLTSQEQQILTQLDTPTTLGQTVIDQMVNEELIRQESVRRGISASGPEIDKALQAAFQFFPAGTPTPSLTPTPVSFPTLSPETLALVTITPTSTIAPTATASLAPTPDAATSPTTTMSPTSSPTAGPTATAESTATPAPTATAYTQQGFEAAYHDSLTQLAGIGLTEAQVRQLYNSSVLRDKLYAEVTADVPRLQEQVWARHILVADEAAALAVRKRLVNGEDFNKLAEEVSTDLGTKSKGGDLGWFGKGAMVGEFEAAAFSLKTGEISQPIKSQFGFHVIQVLAHADVPLDAAGYEQAKQKAFSDWLAKARLEYKVVSYNNWQDAVPTDPAAPAIQQ